jgi:hypothetical protein
VEYDEEDVLARYLFRHASRYMTDVELRADRSAVVEMKAEWNEQRGSTSSARTLREEFGHGDDPAVDAALVDGYKAFRLRVVLRLLSEQEVVAMINRCPACGRIVRTPRARQCLWCGHDWHRRDAAHQGAEPAEER